MASVARFEREVAALRDAGLAHRLRADAPGLAAFRVLVRPDNDQADHERSLSTLIASEIIPRLMVAHAAAIPELATIATAHGITPADIESFAPLVMEVEADAVLAQVEAILARGVTFDTVLVDLLAPTARLLGEYWEDDRCDFVDVTMGLWRLQEVVHEIAGRSPTDGTGVRAAPRRQALFASMPGDQHNFGTVVIDELFRRDGWQTERLTEATPVDLCRCIADEWFDMVGLTISCDSHIENLPSIIAALRNVSRNPRVCVMVGGRIFSADPELAMHVGADGTARDARLALQVAVSLVREREWEAAAVS